MPRLDVPEIEVAEGWEDGSALRLVWGTGVGLERPVYSSVAEELQEVRWVEMGAGDVAWHAGSKVKGLDAGCVNYLE